MKTNQVFTILQQSGGIRAARIITENIKNPSWMHTMLIARQLRRGVPVAKIIKNKWFFGMPFYTNRWTMDPRPDTETLVTAVISNTNSDTKLKILDLGTGTGCIIAAIVKNLPKSTGLGIDKSFFATLVAKRNIKKLGLSDRIKVIRCSFKSKVSVGKFDIIVSNPPYIAHGDKRVNNAAKFDPKLALYAKNNGLAAYEAIAKNAQDWLNSDGKLYIEIGDGQFDSVRNVFTNTGWIFLNAYNDLSGTHRVLCFTR